MSEGDLILTFELAIKVAENDVLLGSIRYRLLSDGSIDIVYDLDFEGLNLPEIPRVGMSTSINADLKQASYFGRGPHENYVDRKRSASIGIYHREVDAFYEAYISPQENGNREDVRWLKILSNDNLGVMIKGSPIFNFTLNPYSSEELTQAEYGSLHHYDMPSSVTTHLYIDLCQRGLGSVDSWGAKPLEKYRILAKKFESGFSILPIISDNA